MADLSKELIQHVLTAGEEGKSLNIVGGNSKSFLGRTAEGDSLKVVGHTGIVSYHPSELVITARAGTSIKEITEALAENGQICSLEPALFNGTATLGGTLACNLSGPARPWQGSIRDAVLGTRLINGKGEYLKFGGQVIKNVAGYDVSRLQAGAFGTLGVITEVSFKVLPKPAASITVSFKTGAVEAITLMNKISAQAVPVTAMTWMLGKLYVRLEGASRAVEGAVKELQGEIIEEATTFWQNLNEQTMAFFEGDKPLWRFSVNSNMSHLYPDENWLLDWGGAQRWLRGDFDKLELEQKALKGKGHVSLFRHGDRSGDVFHTLSPIQQKIHKNLKAAFDPDRVLNAGRLYSWL